MFETRLRVRFHEVDPWGIVWHGHYLSYMEVARNVLGDEVGLGPADLVAAGVAAPIVDARIRYVRPACYGDELRVRLVVERTRTPRLVFHYRVERATSGSGDEYELLAEGQTTQVLVALPPRSGGPAPSSVADVAHATLLFRVPESLKSRLEGLLARYGSNPEAPWGTASPLPRRRQS
ncbi:MAG: acyl-CoA thioesterase [Candidatus Schekmanbacteria bacterium]|nr:acyl-CoA thioesterase [Candidatus Schekmanbacteria bacterium]